MRERPAANGWALAFLGGGEWSGWHRLRPKATLGFELPTPPPPSRAHKLWRAKRSPKPTGSARSRGYVNENQTHPLNSRTFANPSSARRTAYWGLRLEAQLERSRRAEGQHARRGRVSNLRARMAARRLPDRSHPQARGQSAMTARVTIFPSTANAREFWRAESARIGSNWKSLIQLHFEICNRLQASSSWGSS
jgi:hypothetical protein